ncbi:MAG: tripartite tricarboxylate transporter TctB family protein [Alphaproteobacteria bacterium]|nr:tripartite tricarboxylate transporter TctB family protein [Alphaproteobacteria bacterium]
MRIRSQSNFWCGLLFAALGVTVMILARDYRIGSAARMGPGYFPMLLGALLALLGLTLTVPALFRDGPAFPRLHLRPLAFVLLGIAAFGVTLEYLGFVLAVAALVVIGGLADPDLRPVEIAGVALFMAVFSVGVFAVLLGMPLTLWPAL